jgi:hypothetical protein
MSAPKINRRTALEGIGGSVLAALPSPVHPQPHASFHGFVVESGTRGWPDYAVGMLVCPNPLANLRALRSLRAQALFKTGVRGYFRPLKYSSTDRRRIDFARRAIRHFSQQSDMYISMVCAGAMPWPNSAVGKDAVQIQMYQRMLAQIRPTFRNHLTLHVIRRTRNGRDLALLNTVRNNVPFVNSIERAASTDLIALASLIVGSINAANAGQSRLVTADTKLQLQSDLRGALRVGALRPTQLNQTGKVRVLKLA